MKEEFKIWFILKPPYLYFLWIMSFFGLFFVAQRASKYNEDKVFWYSVLSSLSLFILIFSFSKEDWKWSVFSSYLTLFFMYLCYNNVFLSTLKDKSDNELNVLAADILFVGYILALVVAGHHHHPQ